MNDIIDLSTNFSLMSKKGVFITLAVLLVAAAFFVGFQLGHKNGSETNSQSNVDDTNQVTWVSYTDSILPITFQMPDSWSTSRFENSSTTFTIQAGEGFNYYIRIGIADNPSNLSAKDYALQAVEDGIHNPYFDGFLDFGKNKQYEGWRITYVFTTESENEITYVEHNRTIYFFDRLMRSENDTYPNAIENYDISDQILSTLEFTN